MRPASAATIANRTLKCTAWLLHVVIAELKQRKSMHYDKVPSVKIIILGLYCRPHFDQLFKRISRLEKSFEGTPKIMKPEKPLDHENASKVSSLFAGTRDKCVGRSKTVYPIEKVTVNGKPYHKSCFKCTHGGCTISPSNYIAHEGQLYCKHHHIQLFKEKGKLQPVGK